MTSVLSDLHPVHPVAEDISVNHCCAPQTQTSWTHGGRCWGLSRPSPGAGSKMACTARSCVRLCCEDSLRKPPRSRCPTPCTRPCRSDMSPSGGCSCTLKQNREPGHNMNTCREPESLGEALGEWKPVGAM